MPPSHLRVAAVRPFDAALAPIASRRMIARHTLTYLGSRAVAAALNLGSLAAFTRLAPTEVFGTYLFALSWAFVLYGATCQWPKFAFFARYEDGRAAEQVGTMIRLLCAMLVLAGLAAGLAVALGLAEPRLAAAALAVTFGMTVFECANEIARTRLAAEAVGLAAVLRGILVLSLGSLVLHTTGDAIDLVFAVAFANCVAATPSVIQALPLVRRNRASFGEARRFIAYGWPLMIGMGLTALAQSIDRLIIAKTVSVEDLGVYGAVADFLRQSFVVFGESIAASLMSIAKRDARAHGFEAARPVLAEAARTLFFVCAFGAVFFLCFDDLVMAVLLGPAYRDAALRLAPLLILASVCMTIRGFYFGQVIYFTPTSKLEAVASGITLVSIGSLSLALIPRYGVEGAALAVAAGQAVACFVFVVGATGRIRMPFPIGAIAGIVGCAALTGAAIGALEPVPGATSLVGSGLRLTLLGVAAVATAWHFDIAGVAGGLKRLRQRARSRA